MVILLYLENLYIQEKVLKQWLQEKLLLEPQCLRVDLMLECL